MSPYLIENWAGNSKWRWAIVCAALLALYVLGSSLDAPF